MADFSEMTEEQFLRHVNALAPGQPVDQPSTVPVPDMTQVPATATPKTNGSLNMAERVLAPAFSAVSAIGTRQAAKQGDATSLSLLGRREGVPFDISEGAGFMSRLVQQLAFTREEQELLLRRQPNVTDVRFNTLGEPVMTVTDPQTGKTRDILANPVGIDPSDFAFVAANIPELTAGMLAAIGKPASKETVGAIQRLGRWLLSKDVIPSSGRMAIAGQGAGALKDIIGRGIDPSLEVNLGEIGEQRATAATIDALFGIGAGVAGKVAGRVVTPLQNRGPLQLDAEAARQLWRDKGGITIDFTPAEASGNPFLGKSEAFMQQKPGSSAPFDRMMSERRAAVGKMQNVLLGTDPSLIPAADVVGRTAMSGIQSKLAPLDFALNRETQAVLRQASDDILAGVERATGAPPIASESAVGSRLFTRAFELLEEFRAASRKLYSVVFDDPRIAGQGRNIDATPLAEDALRILDDIASVQQPGGRVDALASFVDSNTRAKLEQLVNAAGGKVSLRDLIELRRDIDDDLFRGGALGGLPERRLSEMRTAITKRIEDGLTELDSSGGLKKAWETANAHYAENIRRFKEVDIVEMFKGPQDRGVLGLNQVVTRAISDPDRWRSYRDFFGANSHEMTLMRRAVADRVLGRIPGDNVIDAGAFLSRLESLFQGNTKEIAEDVFGQSASELRGLAKAAKEAGKANMDLGEVSELINQRSLTAEKLRGLMAAQAERDETLKNSILAKIAKGVDGPDAIKPSDFVNTVVFKGEPSEIAGALAFLSDQPELIDQIKQRTLLRIFEDSWTNAAGKETINPLRLDELFLKDETMHKRLTTVLGSETMGMLEAMRDVLKPGSVNEATFVASGRLSAGQQIGTIERRFGDPKTMWSEASHIIKSFLLASLYKAGPVRAYMANSLVGPQGKLINRDAFINSFIVAEPIVEDLLKLTGDELGTIAALQLKGAIDSGVRQAIGEDPSQMDKEQFLEWVRQRAPKQPEQP